MNTEEQETLKRLGEVIRQHRRAQNMTQAELAYFSGIGRTHISRIETGKMGFSILTLLKIAVALEISLSGLFRKSSDSSKKD